VIRTCKANVLYLDENIDALWVCLNSPNQMTCEPMHSAQA